MLFESALYTTPANADSFFRYHDREGTTISEGGDVESPEGYYTVLDVKSANISKYASRHGDPWVTERRNLAPGWYVEQVNSDGVLTCHYYGEGEQAEKAARFDYDLLEDEFAEWAESVQ